MCKLEQIEKFTHCENRIDIEIKFDMLFECKKNCEKPLVFTLKHEKKSPKKILRNLKPRAL